jgi:hypothetical protein
VRHPIDLQADALQDVCGAIDDGVEQIEQHGFAGDVGRAVAGELVADDHERARIVIAHRDEAMAGEDEGHRGGLRRRVSELHISVAVM